MIDVALGLGWAVSEWWVAPTGSLSLGWRPTPAIELQATGTASWMQQGHFTAAGREISRCFCDGTIDRTLASAGLTAGVFPFRERVGRWEVEGGLRVGGALAQTRPAEYVQRPDSVEIKQGPATVVPGWTVEAVAGATIGRYGVRLRLEQLTWISVEGAGASEPVLLPHVEGYLRW